MKNRLEELRKQRAIRQEDLAQALGVSRQTVISLEKGKYNPSLALAFNCLPASFAAGLTGIPAQAAALAVTLCSLGFVWLGQGLGKRLEDRCPGALLTQISSAAMIALDILEMLI